MLRFVVCLCVPWRIVCAHYLSGFRCVVLLCVRVCHGVLFFAYYLSGFRCVALCVCVCAMAYCLCVLFEWFPLCCVVCVCAMAFCLRVLFGWFRCVALCVCVCHGVLFVRII